MSWDLGLLGESKDDVDDDIHDDNDISLDDALAEGVGHFNWAALPNWGAFDALADAASVAPRAVGNHHLLFGHDEDSVDVPVEHQEEGKVVVNQADVDFFRKCADPIVQQSQPPQPQPQLAEEEDATKKKKTPVVVRPPKPPPPSSMSVLLQNQSWPPPRLPYRLRGVDGEHSKDSDYMYNNVGQLLSKRFLMELVRAQESKYDSVPPEHRRGMQEAEEEIGRYLTPRGGIVVEIRCTNSVHIHGTLYETSYSDKLSKWHPGKFAGSGPVQEGYSIKHFIRISRKYWRDLLKDKLNFIDVPEDDSVIVDAYTLSCALETLGLELQHDFPTQKKLEDPYHTVLVDDNDTNAEEGGGGKRKRAQKVEYETPDIRGTRRPAKHYVYILTTCGKFVPIVNMIPKKLQTWSPGVDARAELANHTLLTSNYVRTATAVAPHKAAPPLVCVKLWPTVRSSSQRALLKAVTAPVPPSANFQEIYARQQAEAKVREIRKCDWFLQNVAVVWQRFARYKSELRNIKAMHKFNDLRVSDVVVRCVIDLFIPMMHVAFDDSAILPNEIHEENVLHIITKAEAATKDGVQSKRQRRVDGAPRPPKAIKPPKAPPREKKQKPPPKIPKAKAPKKTTKTNKSKVVLTDMEDTEEEDSDSDFNPRKHKSHMNKKKKKTRKTLKKKSSYTSSSSSDDDVVILDEPPSFTARRLWLKLQKRYKKKMEKAAKKERRRRLKKKKVVEVMSEQEATDDAALLDNDSEESSSSNKRHTVSSIDLAAIQEAVRKTMLEQLIKDPMISFDPKFQRAMAADPDFFNSPVPVSVA